MPTETKTPTMLTLLLSVLFGIYWAALLTGLTWGIYTSITGITMWSVFAIVLTGWLLAFHLVKQVHA